MVSKSGLTGLITALGLVATASCAATRTAKTHEAPAPQAQPASAAEPSLTEASDSRTTREESSRPDGSEEPLAVDAGVGPAIQPVPGCVELRGANDCLGVGAVMLACTALGNVLEPPVSNRVVECLSDARDTEALCDTRILRKCGLQATRATPTVPGIDGVCRALLSKCPAPAEYEDVYRPDKCASALSSLRPAERDDFIACMQERCDLLLCVSRLL